MFKKISAKLILLFLLIGIIPLATVSIVSAVITSGQLETEAKNKLEAIRDLKKGYIEKFVHDYILEVEAVANDQKLVELTNDLQGYFKKMNIGEKDEYPVDTTAYKQIYNKYYDYFNAMKEKYDFYDIFVIGVSYGHVAFTISQESDFGANLKHGIYRDTHLAELWKSVKETNKTHLIDFKPYAPSNGEPASFIGTPIKEDGEVLAIFAIQVSLNEINSIMQDRTGMGGSGETYLIGEDYLPRSDLYFGEGKHSVLYSFQNPQQSKIQTIASEKALTGKEGIEIIKDYRGVPVYSAYEPLDIEGVNWAIMAEIDVSEVNAPINTMIITIVIIAVVISAIILVLSILLSRSIANPIKQATGLISDMAKGRLTDERAETKSKDEIGTLIDSLNVMLDFLIQRNVLMGKIAGGDLRVNVKLASEEDEVGISLKEMVESLNDIIRQINASVEQIEMGSNQISESTQQLSAGSSEQASSLEEITASASEIASQAQGNVDNANKADNIATKTKDNAESGNKQMRQLVLAMEQINKSSNDIKNVIKIIDDIAFQTNLLALNADIEAARVGKYGKGFAVVANSVRTLASKSAKAVKETAVMIDEAIENIEKGNNLVDVTAKQLEEIENIAVDLKNIVQEVTEASQDQAAGIEEMNTGLNQIEDVVQSNSANAEENAAATEELSAQAKRLKEMVSHFKISDDSDKLLSTTKMIGSDKGNGNGNGRSYGDQDGNGKSKEQGQEKALTPRNH